MSDVVTAVPLKRTPLYRLHLDLGGRMVPFAGYEMPVQYPSGILKEHLHVRAAAGLFDVSHMGQFEIRSRTGGGEDAARALELIVPMDIVGLAPGRQRYALLTNEDGGVRDDLMIARLGEVFLVVANAGLQGRRRILPASDAVAHLHDRASATIGRCWRCKDLPPRPLWRGWRPM